MEQYARNRLIRPLAAYVGPENRPFPPINAR
jgi:citrate synthase